MQKEFRIRLCSDLDYEEMVADIVWDNNSVAMITQEKGVDHMMIEIFPPIENNNSWNFPLNDLIGALIKAQKHLIDMKKNS